MEYFNRYVLGHAILNPELQWRYHGIGVLQAYLHEGDHEVRVHIWHPKLMLADFTEENGLVHDHRFSFTSFVMLGSIFDDRFHLTPRIKGDWQIHTTMNARQYASTTGNQYGSMTDTEPESSELYAAYQCGRWYQEGSHYEMEARLFHRTVVHELTVTLIVKRSLADGSARILCKRGERLINAFEHDNPIDVTYINTASARLLGKSVYRDL